MPRLFDPLVIRGITLKNRIMMSPMCMYCADEDGRATDWHFVHYGTRAAGGAGIIMLEATAVESRGRLSVNDLGLWSDSQIEPLARIARFCREQGALAGVQLGHGGRKAFSNLKAFGPEETVGPSPLSFASDWKVPKELRRSEIGAIVEAFAAAARRAKQAGFGLVEIHAAHGYLLHEFLSPLSNRREDEYGGDLEGRTRLVEEVIRVVRSELDTGVSQNERQPVFVRVSATDWTEGGITPEEMSVMARRFADIGADLIDVSSGGLLNAQISLRPGYQAPLAEIVRRRADVMTAAVGLITEPELADEIVASGRADVVAVGRELLRNPYWPLEAARVLRRELEWPVQYQRAQWR